MKLKTLAGMVVFAGALSAVTLCSGQSQSPTDGAKASPYKNKTGRSQAAFDAAVAQYKSAPSPSAKFEVMLTAVKAAPNLATVNEFLRIGPLPLPERRGLERNLEWLAEYVEVPAEKSSDFNRLEILLGDLGFPPELTD